MVKIRCKIFENIDEALTAGLMTKRKDGKLIGFWIKVRNPEQGSDIAPMKAYFMEITENYIGIRECVDPEGV